MRIDAIGLLFLLSVPVHATEFPVRIPVDELQNSPLADVTIQIGDENKIVLTTQGQTSWRPEETTLEPPEAGALADFRDYLGCAYLDPSQVAVCFNVMPDVSSVGVNASEMQLKGMENYMNDRLYENNLLSSCSHSIETIRYVSSTRTHEQVIIHFKGKITPGADCRDQEPLNTYIEWHFTTIDISTSSLKARPL